MGIDPAMVELIERVRAAGDSTKRDGGSEIRLQVREAFALPMTISVPKKDVSVARTDDPANRAEVGSMMVEGLASSTSVDSYGTEMSLDALRSMADQMKKGVPLLPRHNNGAFGAAVEWDEVIGMTTTAEIEKAEVVDPADAGEEGYVLRVGSKLTNGDKKASELMRRLDRGQPIGQSIGGWFVEVRVLMDDEDNVERVIVEQVELDHLALTRRPANPDSNGLYTLRSRLGDALRSVSEKEIAFRADAEASRADEDSDGSGDSGGTEDSVEDAVEELEVSEFEGLPLADVDAEFDWTEDAQDAVLADGDWARYGSAHIWYDSEETDSKDDYKLPFALDFDGELKAVWRGVSSAMEALNEGADIPEADRQAAYDHLVEYYKLFDYEAPELAPLEEEIVEDPDSDSEAESIPNGDDSGVELSDVQAGPEPETNNPCGVIGETVFDAETETVHDDSVDGDSLRSQTPTDARGSAESVNPKSQKEDEPMNEKDLDAIKVMLDGALGGLAERVASLETASVVPEEVAAVPTETINPDMEALRARLDAAESMVSKLANQPVRHGRAPTNIRGGVGCDSVFGALIERSKTEGNGVALASVVERHSATVSEEDGPSKATVAHLRDLLSAGLRAAERDGLIGDTQTAAWR